MVGSVGADAWSGLEPLIVQGDYNRLTLAVEDLSEAQRSAVIPVVSAWMRDRYRFRPDGPRPDGAAAAIIGAGALTSAAKMTAWLSRNEMSHHRQVVDSQSLHTRYVQGTVVPNVFYLLTTRQVDWLDELIERLAEGLPKEDGFGRDRFELVERLREHTRHAMPVTDGYAACWTQFKGPEATLAQLVGEPRATELVTRFFAVEQVLAAIERDSRWPVALTRLVDQGDVRRAEVIDACIARLARGGKTGGDRASLTIMRLLVLTRPETSGRKNLLLDVLRSKTSTVAEYARSTLCGLADRGDLDPADYAELLARSLARPEKKLIRAQLRHLASVAPTSSDVPLFAQSGLRAVAWSKTDLQREVVRAVAALSTSIPSASRTAVVAAADRLPADLIAELASALGVAPFVRDEAAAVRDALAPPARVRLQPVRELSELAELAHRSFEPWVDIPDTPTLERLIDGLLRFAVEDRAALTDALAPVLALRSYTDHADGDDERGNRFDRSIELFAALPALIAAIVGRPVRQAQRDVHLVGLEGALVLRVRALTAGVNADGPRLPISLPTWTNGLIEPDDLLERVADPRAATWDVEVEQALLRLDLPAGDDARAELAQRFGDITQWSPANRAADWIRHGGPATPPIQVVPVAQSHHDSSGDHIDDDAVLLASLAAAGGSAPTGELWAALTRAGVGAISDDYWGSGHAACWAALAPRHRDLLFAHCGQTLVRGRDLTNGVFAALPALAGIDGSFGPASALALGYALGTKRADQRAPTVDSLVTLLAREQVDVDLLGATLAELIVQRRVVTKRVVQGLADTAALGVSTRLWPVVTKLLSPLLAAPDVTGLVDVLGFAAELAERVRPTDVPDGLTDFAARKGSNRTHVEARRLARLIDP